MTKTYILLDKGTIAKPPLNNFFEDHYVTYTEPSEDDRNWKLVFYAHWYPHMDRPTHYFRCYQFLDDAVAREDYPIFRRLAVARNWAPMDPIPELTSECKHLNTTIIGLSANYDMAYDRCLDCRKVLRTTS